MRGERLRFGLVAEHVEDAGCGGDGVAVEHAFDPGSKLLLREKLLEGPLAGHDPVALEVDGGVRRLPVEAGRDDEHLPGKLPSGGEDDDPLVRVFDDVDHVAEIHDVGGSALFIGKERGIPAGHGNTHLPQPQQVVPAPAAVVEERALSTDDVVLDRKRHRPRQRVPADRRSVRSCRTHGTSPASAYLRFAGCAVLSDAALQERNVERCRLRSSPRSCGLDPPATGSDGRLAGARSGCSAESWKRSGRGARRLARLARAMGLTDISVAAGFGAHRETPVGGAGPRTRPVSGGGWRSLAGWERRQRLSVGEIGAEAAIGRWGTGDQSPNARKRRAARPDGMKE